MKKEIERNRSCAHQGPSRRIYNATAKPAAAIAAAANEPRLFLEAAPVKAEPLADADLLAAGTVGAVPFPLETALPVGAATPEVAMAKPEDPAPVALRMHSQYSSKPSVYTRGTNLIAAVLVQEQTVS